MKKNITILIYVLSYLAYTFIFLMNERMCDIWPVGDENFMNRKGGTYAIIAFSVVGIYAVLMLCNLIAKHYAAIVFNSILAAALLSMHFRQVSIILMAFILTVGLITALMLVYVNIRDNKS